MQIGICTHVHTHPHTTQKGGRNGRSELDVTSFVTSVFKLSFMLKRDFSLGLLKAKSSGPAQ